MAATRPHRTNAETSAGARAEMAATWTLHIQTGDDSTTRVLPLGSGSIRVGRGIHCEVRLNQVGLGDVQCLIRRRNNQWHLQPVGPPGRIWVDNHPTDNQRELPVGAALRVGRSTLVIHGSEPDEPQRGSFDAPITIDAEPVEVGLHLGAAPEPAALAPEPEPEQEPESVAPASDTTVEPTEPAPGDDRAKRWQTRLEQRDQWLKDRQSEKRWEARWKAAGETLRARATPPSPPAPTPPPAAPIQEPPATPLAGRPLPSRSPGVRAFEPRPVFGHLRRVAEPEPKPAEPPRVPIRPPSASFAPARVEAAPTPPPVEVEVPESVEPPAVVPVPQAPPVLAATSAELTTEPLSSDFDDVESVFAEFVAIPRPVEPTREPVAKPPAQVAPSELIASPLPEVVPAPTPTQNPERSVTSVLLDLRVAGVGGTPQPRSADQVAEPIPGVAPPRQPQPPKISEAQAGPGLASVELESELAPAQLPPEPVVIKRSAPVDPSRPKPTRTAPRIQLAVNPGPKIASPPPGRPEAEARPYAGSEAIHQGPTTAGPIGAGLPSDAAVDPKAYPSARAIFAAQGVRTTGAARSPSVVEPTRQRSSPEPTVLVRPDAWAIPFALGWLPSVALVLALGGFAIGLAVVWLEDAASGNIAIRLATRPEGTRSPTIDTQTIPKSAWWQTTASHLAAWALTMERVGGGEDRSADARILEADARNASPLGARARFISEPVLGQEADAAASIRLGPTRDVITLTAMAHRLRRENKRSDALRAYTTAFRTAATTARATLNKPFFRGETQINRYALPHSSLLDGVARDMVSAGEWSPEEWAEATPVFGPAYLAVASAVREKEPVAADRRLEAICQLADQPLDKVFEGAEHLAAIAEALAERGRWTDSVAQYRLAIDAETRDLDRRVWWFNLAEVAGKTGDRNLRNEAIESAKGADLSDEVTQRAANAHKNEPETR